MHAYHRNLRKQVTLVYRVVAEADGSTERPRKTAVLEQLAVGDSATFGGSFHEPILRGVAEKAASSGPSTAALQESISSLRDEMYRNADKVKTSLRKEVADLRDTTTRSLELLQREMHLEHGEARYGSLLMDEINTLKGQASRPTSPRALTRSDSFSSAILSRSLSRRISMA